MWLRTVCPVVRFRLLVPCWLPMMWTPPEFGLCFDAVVEREILEIGGKYYYVPGGELSEDRG